MRLSAASRFAGHAHHGSKLRDRRARADISGSQYEVRLELEGALGFDLGIETDASGEAERGPPRIVGVKRGGSLDAAATAAGVQVRRGDALLAVNARQTTNAPFSTVLAMLTTSSRPVVLRFSRRKPPAPFAFQARGKMQNAAGGWDSTAATVASGANTSSPSPQRRWQPVAKSLQRHTGTSFFDLHPSQYQRWFERHASGRASFVLNHQLQAQHRAAKNSTPPRSTSSLISHRHTSPPTSSSTIAPQPRLIHICIASDAYDVRIEFSSEVTIGWLVSEALRRHEEAAAAALPEQSDRMRRTVSFADQRPNARAPPPLPIVIGVEHDSGDGDMLDFGDEVRAVLRDGDRLRLVLDEAPPVAPTTAVQAASTAAPVPVAPRTPPPPAARMGSRRSSLGTWEARRNKELEKIAAGREDNDSASAPEQSPKPESHSVNDDDMHKFSSWPPPPSHGGPTPAARAKAAKARSKRSGRAQKSGRRAKGQDAAQIYSGVVAAEEIEAWALFTLRGIGSSSSPSKLASADADPNAAAAKLLGVIVEKLEPAQLEIWSPALQERNASLSSYNMAAATAPSGAARLRIRARLAPALLSPSSGALELATLHSGKIDAMARIANTDSFVATNWRIRPSDSGWFGLQVLSTDEGKIALEVVHGCGSMDLVQIPEAGERGWERHIVQRAIPSWVPLPAEAKEGALSDMRASFNNVATFNPVTHVHRFVLQPPGAGRTACTIMLDTSVPLDTIQLWWCTAPTDVVGQGSERSVGDGLYAGMYDVPAITASQERARAAVGDVAAQQRFAAGLWNWRRRQMAVEIALQVCVFTVLTLKPLFLCFLFPGVATDSFLLPAFLFCAAAH